jgi:hypothetical protein
MSSDIAIIIAASVASGVLIAGAAIYLIVQHFKNKK